MVFRSVRQKGLGVVRGGGGRGGGRFAQVSDYLKDNKRASFWG